MDTQRTTLDTPAWIFLTRAAFGIAVGFMAWGISSLPVDIWQRGFLGLGFVFTIFASFTLSKTIRDNHEARKLINRVKDARTEKIIREYEEPADMAA